MDDPIFLTDKEHMERLLQYTFKRPELLREAMYSSKGIPARLPGGRLLHEANFHLAQVGDAVLRTTLLDHWHEHQSATIGARESRLQVLVTDKNLALVAETHGIVSLLHKRYPSDGRSGPSKKAVPTTVEAIIGAVW
jgi:dsRNA-specific ribonuclease